MDILINRNMISSDFKIVQIGDKAEYDSWSHPNKKAFKKEYLKDTQFLLPGFVDTHIHAPQVPNIGLGLDKPLMEWLNAYTFPIETQYKDSAFAKHVYEKVVVSSCEINSCNKKK